MPAVTINRFTDNVPGSLRERIYDLSIAASGDTLDVPWGLLKGVTFNDTAITKAAISGSTITFTTTGAVANALVNVVGQ